MEVMNNSKIILIALVVFNINCYKLNSKISNSPYGIYFSNIPEKNITKLEIDKTYFYWFGYTLNEDKNFQELLEENLKKYPGAKGIKNLRVRFYNKSWFSLSLLPNPFGLLTSSFWIYFGYPLGFSNKSVFIEGDVY